MGKQTANHVKSSKKTTFAWGVIQIIVVGFLLLDKIVKYLVLHESERERERE